MFDRLLIANRGEIACRVALTCRRMGIATVAVYSEADAEARHVALCDEAWLLGPAPPRDSYLRADRILEIAAQSGAQAIHPGYGFLSENADFAEACDQAGVVFIGPGAAAIRAMGSKSAAKRIMGSAGVPLVPGYHEQDQSLETLTEAAHRTGFPLLIKATAGGGGKGMRRVDTIDEFATALAGARREASAAFGDDQVLLEKFLLQPRHIEVQVFADNHGATVHLFDRDCSIQRRHQKILEEAPAPGLSAGTRQQMAAAAIAAARAIDYRGAGTVEFIAENDGQFYFMEMNTRLQVEHPVTEMITGVDLVEWQLRVAAGEPLPRTAQQLEASGHAFEARIYAEDPEHEFLPATGRIQHLRTPPPGPHLRIDSGIREGDEVGIHYDPMIAKLVVWDLDRDSALRRLRHALREYQVVGLTTNLEFLTAVVAQPDFAAAAISTDFIERHHDSLFPERAPAPVRVLAIAVLSELLRIEADAREAAGASADRWSPWHSSSGWRLNDDNHHCVHLRDGEQLHTVTAHYRRDHYRLEINDTGMRAAARIENDGSLRIELDQQRFSATVVRDANRITVLGDGHYHHLLLEDPLSMSMDSDFADDNLCAPMPGTIIAVHVTSGDTVAAGDPLVVLEAMKMEHTIVASTRATIAEVFFAVGEQVDEGAQLITLEATE